jgi:hypothetical protein
MKILISENQLKTVAVPFFNKKIENEEMITELRNRWNDLDRENKILVLELYRTFHPEKVELLKEDEDGFWTKFADKSQSLLDVAGIFDPTGIADAVNATWYFARGEVLFGMLSLISVVPYIGDALGKPIMLLAKAGGKEVKLITKALSAKNATKLAEATKSIKNTAFGKKMMELLTKFADGSVGREIMKYVKKGTKVKIVGKFFKAIEGWVELFKSAGKQIKVPTKLKNIELKTPQGIWKGAVKGSERVDWGSVFKQAMKPTSPRFFRGLSKVDDFKVFRELSKKGKKSGWALKTFWDNIWRVPETRKLMNKSKLFLRFLDWVGLGNFVGPEEELYAKLDSIPNVSEEFADYANSPEGQRLFDDEVGSAMYAGN